LINQFLKTLTLVFVCILKENNFYGLVLQKLFQREQIFVQAKGDISLSANLKENESIYRIRSVQTTVKLMTVYIIK